jgi:hypothetical protein
MVMQGHYGTRCVGQVARMCPLAIVSRTPVIHFVLRSFMGLDPQIGLIIG